MLSNHVFYLSYKGLDDPFTSPEPIQHNSLSETSNQMAEKIDIGFLVETPTSETSSFGKIPLNADNHSSIKPFGHLEIISSLVSTNPRIPLHKIAIEMSMSESPYINSLGPLRPRNQIASEPGRDIRIPMFRVACLCSNSGAVVCHY